MYCKQVILGSAAKSKKQFDTAYTFTGKRKVSYTVTIRSAAFKTGVLDDCISVEGLTQTNTTALPA